MTVLGPFVAFIVCGLIGTGINISVLAYKLGGQKSTQSVGVTISQFAAAFCFAGLAGVFLFKHDVIGWLFLTLYSAVVLILGENPTEGKSDI